MKHIPTLLLVFFLAVFQVNSQQYTTRSSRAKKAFEQAQNMYGMYAFGQAVEYLKDCIKHDPKYVDAWFFMAQIYRDIDSLDLHISALTRGIGLDSAIYPPAFLLRSEAWLSQGEYEKSLSDATYFIEHSSVEFEKLQPMAIRLKKSCEFAIENLKTPSDIDLKPLPNTINTRLDEYWPSFTVDNQRFYYTVKTPTPHGRYREDIYTCYMTDSTIYDNPNPLDAPVNTNDNEGASFISPDGRYLFFTGCNRSDGYGSCDIYMAMQEDNGWSRPKNVGKLVNSRQWESRPVVSYDGNNLYFASNRQGGYGKSDIYMSKKTGYGPDGFPIWDIPQNLGAVVNTPGDEMAPFIHADNKTLYFSSDYHIGMGNFDLFKTELVDGKWTKPINLAYPINSYLSEIGIFVQSNGTQAYVDKEVIENGNEKTINRDIFTFYLPEEARAGKATYVSGKVVGKDTKQPLSVNVEIYDFDTKSYLMTLKSNPNGTFLVAMAAGKKYGLTVERSEYLFYSDHFEIDPKQIEAYKLYIELEPVKAGNRTVLNNVFFETGSYILSSDSKAELDRIVSFLIQNPTVTVEIGGHTDITGSEQNNKLLSENRSKEVYNYLINNNVSNTRLSYKGYASSKPIDDNETTLGRAKNRRTEMTIISK